MKKDNQMLVRVHEASCKQIQHHAILFKLNTTLFCDVLSPFLIMSTGVELRKLELFALIHVYNLVHEFTSQSGYANLVRCVWFETPMKHWTEAFPR